MPLPSNAIKHRCSEILQSPSGFAKFKRIMAKVEKPEVFLAYFKECVDRAYGKAPQHLDITAHEDISPVTNDDLENLVNGNGHREAEGGS